MRYQNPVTVFKSHPDEKREYKNQTCENARKEKEKKRQEDGSGSFTTLGYKDLNLVSSNP